MSKRALITGGAGYIGAHMVRFMCDRGWDVVVVDDLSTGHREAVDPRARLFVCSLENQRRLEAILQEIRPHVVLHFAAKAVVAESLRHPWKYWHTNVHGTLHLLLSMQKAGVSRLVFSSSCAVYGPAQSIPIRETHPLQPEHPYGETKLACERMIHAFAQETGLRAIVLRYFNVAGCCGDPRLRERHEPETHLFPNLLDAALHGHTFVLHGTTHPTKDGSAVRDFIHVLDLAEAHYLAAKRTDELAKGEVRTFNLGSGTGLSVREAIRLVERITQRTIQVKESPPRAGDPSVLVADATAWRQWSGQPAAMRSPEAMVRDMWRAWRA